MFTHMYDIYRTTLQCSCGRAMAINMVMPTACIESFDCLCGKHTLVNRYPQQQLPQSETACEPK